MKWLRWWKKTDVDDDLQELEMRLQGTLVPVAPRAEFVEGLRKNLLIQFSGMEIAPPEQNQRLQTGILVAGGVAGSILVVLAGVRGIVSLVGIAGLLISYFKQNSKQSAVPSEMA